MSTQKPLRIRVFAFVPTWALAAGSLLVAGFSVLAVRSGFASRADAYPVAAIFAGVLLALHFSPRGWLQFSPDRTQVRFVPWYRSSFTIMAWPVTVEPPEAMPLTHDTELLLCSERSSGEFSVRVRQPDGATGIIWSTSGWFTRSEAAKLACAIERQSGFQVRLLEYSKDAAGEREYEWTAESDRRFHRGMVYTVLAGLCPWAGFVVRTMTTDMRVILGCGMIFWVCGACLAVAAYKSRPFPGADGQPAWFLPALGSLVFALMYTVSVLIAGGLLSRNPGR